MFFSYFGLDDLTFMERYYLCNVFDSDVVKSNVSIVIIVIY